MHELSQLLFLILTYLIASIPFGLLLSLIFAKKDIREFGSKNIGATNVTRVLGKKLGLATLILDGVKGAVMVLIAGFLFVDLNNLNNFLYLVAFMAILGHVFSIYLKFKGGKGVATTIATLLALDLTLGMLVIAVWLGVFVLFRISAISALSAIFAGFIFVIFAQYSNFEIIFMFVVLALIVIRHKTNIKELLSKKK